MIIFGKPCKYLSKQFFLMENCRFPSVFPVFLKQIQTVLPKSLLCFDHSQITNPLRIPRNRPRHIQENLETQTNTILVWLRQPLIYKNTIQDVCVLLEVTHGSSVPSRPHYGVAKKSWQQLWIQWLPKLLHWSGWRKIQKMSGSKYWHQIWKRDLGKVVRVCS